MHIVVDATPLRETRPALERLAEVLKEERRRSAPYLGLALVGLLLGSCTSSVRSTGVTLERYDQDTEYAVTPRDNGFTLTIYASRYQCVPESAVIAMACKSKLTAMAHDLAEKQGRTLRPVDEQRLTITMERNGFRGITSCAGSAIAAWESSTHARTRRCLTRCAVPCTAPSPRCGGPRWKAQPLPLPRPRNPLSRIRVVWRSPVWRWCPVSQSIPVRPSLPWRPCSGCWAANA